MLNVEEKASSSPDLWCCSLGFCSFVVFFHSLFLFLFVCFLFVFFFSFGFCFSFLLGFFLFLLFVEINIFRTFVEV